MPATNYRSWEIIDSTATAIIFMIHYPAWEVAGAQVSLDIKTAEDWFKLVNSQD